MTNMVEKIDIEPIDNSKAIKYAIFIILYYIVWRTFFKDWLQNDEINWIYSLSIVIICIISAIQGVQIAKNLNRDIVFWAIFSFVAPWLALFIIGFLDEKYDDADLKKVVNDCRADYTAEKVYITKDLDLTTEQRKTELEKLKEKHNKILHDKIIKIMSEIRIREIQKLDEDGYIDTKVDYQFQKEKLIQSMESETYNVNSEDQDMTKCPACGYKIDPELVICPDCGLTLR